MSPQEFNKKYERFLEKDQYGLVLTNRTAIEYLDKIFQEFIKIPGFSYSQIKYKFGNFCFYNEGLTREKTTEVETKLKEIYENKNY